MMAILGDSINIEKKAFHRLQQEKTFLFFHPWYGTLTLIISDGLLEVACGSIWFMINEGVCVLND